MTADLGALAAGKRGPTVDKPSKKSRSKSIGPGGLDALQNTNGNRRKVGDEPLQSQDNANPNNSL